MVHLSKIYTRSGDGGDTGLGDGTRVSKADARIWAYGDVDELGSVIGICRTQGGAEDVMAELEVIQNDLFDVGADLCVPLADDEKEGDRLRMTIEQVERLEVQIDARNAGLPELKSFVLSGGCSLGAHLHHARCVARRAERRTVDLAGRDAVNPHVIQYLNRLSDYLFVLARFVNKDGNHEILWRPGGER